jgi:hypothetical protein
MALLHSIIVTNRGERYTSTPTVAISSSPSHGGTAVGIATLIDGLIDCDGTETGSKVQGVQIINPGFGYTVAPGVVFIGGGGSGAAATTRISNQAIGIVTISEQWFWLHYTYSYCYIQFSWNWNYRKRYCNSKHWRNN